MNKDEKRTRSSLKSTNWLYNGKKQPEGKKLKETSAYSNVTFTDEEMDILSKYMEKSGEKPKDNEHGIHSMSTKVQIKLNEKRIQKNQLQSKLDLNDTGYKTLEASDIDDYVISPRNELDYDANDFFEYGQRKAIDKTTKTGTDDESLSLQSSAQIMKEQAWAHIHEQNNELNPSNTSNFRSTYLKGTGTSAPQRKISVGRKRILNIIAQTADNKDKGTTFSDKPDEALKNSYTAQQFRNYLIQKNLEVPAVLDNLGY